MVELVFKGIDGTELEAFMLHVRRLALSEGKQRDDEWLLDVVTANLAEGAMRWFESLEEEQQKDWKFVKKGLFEKYPAPVGRDATKLVATPVTIPPVVPAYTPAAPFIPTPVVISVVPAKRGRLRISLDSGRLAYVSRNQKEGLNIATSTASEQDIFEFPATMPQSLRTCHIPGQEETVLGVSQQGFTSIRASFATATNAFPSRLINSDNNKNAIIHSVVWRVLDTGDIELWVTIMSPDEPLQVMLKGEDISLMSLASANRLVATGGGWEKAKLTLEEA